MPSPARSPLQFEGDDLERCERELELAVADGNLCALPLEQVTQGGSLRRQRGPDAGAAAATPGLVKPDDRRVRILGSLDRLDDHLGCAPLDQRAPLAGREAALHHTQRRVESLRRLDGPRLAKVA